MPALGRSSHLLSLIRGEHWSGPIKRSLILKIISCYFFNCAHLQKSCSKGGIRGERIWHSPRILAVPFADDEVLLVHLKVKTICSEEKSHKSKTILYLRQ